MPKYVYDHIHLRSPDPMKTAEFYQRMFDARIIETPQPSAPNRVDLDFDGLLVFIAGALPSGEEKEGLRDPHYGLDHFGFRVDDLDATVRDLKSRGAEFAVEPMTMPNGLRIAFVRGPEDVRVEILERPA